MLALAEIVNLLREHCSANDYQNITPLLMDVEGMLAAYSVDSRSEERIREILGRLLPIQLNASSEEIHTDLSALIAEIQTIIDNKTTSRNKQARIIARISAIGGYQYYKGGLCVGLSHMAKQAFLMDDLETFKRRLQTIYDMPVDVFRNDFRILREKKQEYLTAGLIDKADEINDKIVDITAFFDGVVLISKEDKSYPEVTHEAGSLLDTLKNTLSIILPKALESTLQSGEKFIYADLLTDACKDKQAWQDYLETMRAYLGENSFALTLGYRHHEVFLAYHAVTKRWIFMDPNQLPGEEYLHIENLVNDMFIRWNDLPWSSSTLMEITVNIHCLSQEVALQCIEGLNILKRNMITLWPDIVYKHESPMIEKTVLEAIADQLPAKCKSAIDISYIMASLITDQHKHDIFEALYDKFPEFICSAVDFSRVMHCLLPAQRERLYKTLESKLLEFCNTPQNMIYVMHFMSPEARRLLYAQILTQKRFKLDENADRFHRELISLLQEGLQYSQVMHDASFTLLMTQDVVVLMQDLRPSQKIDFWSSISTQVAALLHTPQDVERVMSVLLRDQKIKLFEEIEPKLLGMCETVKDIVGVMKHLPLEQRQRFYAEMKQKRNFSPVQNTFFASELASLLKVDLYDPEQSKQQLNAAIRRVFIS